MISLIFLHKYRQTDIDIILKQRKRKKGRSMQHNIIDKITEQLDSEENLAENLLNNIRSPQFKSIQKKLEFYLIGAFSTFTILVCILVTIACYDSTILTLESMAKISASESAQNFSKELSTFELCMKDLAQYSIFGDVNKYKNEIIELLEYKESEYWFHVSFITPDGYDIRSGEYLGGTDYFIGASSGNFHVSSPIILNGANVMPMAYPAYNLGEYVGVMYFAPDTNYMDYLLNLIPISEKNEKFIIDNKGNYILSGNVGQYIGTPYNPLNDSSVRPSEVAMISNAIQGELGYYNFQNTDGDWLFATYTAIPNTDGWVMISTAYSLEFLSRLVYVVAISILLCLTISSIIVFKVRKNIGNFVKPIDTCINRVSSLAVGNVNEPVEIFETGDEVEELSRCLDTIVNNLSTLVKDESYMLNQMANGNFNIESKYPEVYMGDYKPLLVSINKILDDMNGMLSQISTASVEVTFGSENVSTSAQSLAMGAHNQEQSSEALLQSFEQISTGIVVSSEKALKAQQLTDKTGKEVKVGSALMLDLRTAMSEIYDSSQQISSIINSIKDVAFQTNILSLNASVEAARAGSAGAGFAVVADEVRSLALRSSTSAKNTEKLITATLEAVERGSQITNATADSLDIIVECIEEAIIAINDIAGTMTDQTSEVKVVIRSLEEISQVINSTSCTSQESAAVSEELSAQAQALSGLVMKFKLKD